MKPRVALLLGDPAGVGPELVARLLGEDQARERADILVIGDRWLLHQGAARAGTTLELPVVAEPEALGGDVRGPALLEFSSVAPEEIRLGEASAAGGRSVLACLEHALSLATRGTVDAVVFAPLNKQAMHLAGYGFEDELHWFAHVLDHRGHCGELNVLGGLWTARVTSHVALKDVAALVTRPAVTGAITFVDASLRRAGIERPRIAVAALNPHAGDGGIFGREEIDVIAPAIEEARGRGVAADGPFPADTVFLRARDGAYDAVVTMYHDQGQIAMKLMGFDRGVTVAGGLPVPVTTPAHGTAYDIAGRGEASVAALRQAFLLACRMGEAARE